MTSGLRAGCVVTHSRPRTRGMTRGWSASWCGNIFTEVAPLHGSDQRCPAFHEERQRNWLCREKLGESRTDVSFV